MQVISIAECSKGSILQYFRPSLSYCLSLRSLFCLFLNGYFNKTGFTVDHMERRLHSLHTLLNLVTRKDVLVTGHMVQDSVVWLC